MSSSAQPSDGDRDGGQVGRDSFLRTLTVGLAASLAAPSAASAKSGKGGPVSTLDRERRKIEFAFKHERRLVHAEIEFVKELRREMARGESASAAGRQ
eukprot:CAMPEP_0113546376 /NCGR_PEP_ID=MMETSP0015_2-20120614/11770_1 /TAXON_ID=2838 /ORGANISM="Odontella" /LENGTH=97 /DNA_ID=CAMNT_0000446821 /DNA_START=196 /DNA_END=488 /DNA_ORIENTATION=+ /assembly_acc=CAM_ASM_000160